MIVHFLLGYRLLRGVLVPDIGSGVVVGRIAVQGGRESALLVDTATGPRVVRDGDLVEVAS